MIVRDMINKLLDLEPDGKFYVEIDGELFNLDGCELVGEDDIEDAPATFSVSVEVVDELDDAVERVRHITGVNR